MRDDAARVLVDLMAVAKRLKGLEDDPKVQKAIAKAEQRLRTIEHKPDRVAAQLSRVWEMSREHNRRKARGD